MKALFLRMKKPTLLGKYSPHVCLNVVLRYNMNWICCIVNIILPPIPPKKENNKSPAARQPIELEQI